MQTYSSIHLGATEVVTSAVDDSLVRLSISRRSLIGPVANLTLVLPHGNGLAANAAFLQALADEAHTLAVACDELAAVSA